MPIGSKVPEKILARLRRDYGMEEDKKGSQAQCIRLRIGNQGFTLVVACITALCMTFTLFFAYNSSLKQPYLSLFVSKTPERSILILNLASQLTVFALAEMMASVLDATRWTLACSTSGIPALTFVALSRATSFFGALYLSMGGSGVPGRNSLRMWGAQRYILLLD
jgi:hypothetical protein